MIGSGVQEAPLLTVEEVAAKLNVPKARVYELARRRMVPCVRLGRQVRFDPESLAEFIRTGGVELEAEGRWQ